MRFTKIIGNGKPSIFKISKPPVEMMVDYFL